MDTKKILYAKKTNWIFYFPDCHDHVLVLPGQGHPQGLPDRLKQDVATSMALIYFNYCDVLIKYNFLLF